MEAIVMRYTNINYPIQFFIMNMVYDEFLWNNYYRTKLIMINLF